MKWVQYVVIAICLTGCGSKRNIQYQDSLADGCIYSEEYRPRQWFWDWFGMRDSDLTVKYTGIMCKTIIEKELQDEAHKKPYNSVQVVSELPQKVIVK
ncbi:MAG: hypothetical protein NC311_00995 [Muribaculaceae bacterium]|nr:hypothetical protein [Muribaculaceae bacterium]